MANERGIAEKAALERFLNSREPQLARIVARVTRDMRDAITYDQIRRALLSGAIDSGWIDRWRQVYAEFVSVELARHWHMAMIAAAERDDRHRAERGRAYVFKPQQDAVVSWVRQRAATLISDITQNQLSAIRLLVEQATSSYGMGVDGLAMFIRPLIGLRYDQVGANWRYFENVKARLTQLHPKTPASKIDDRARRAAARYAERQHRARAAMIARTELVAAYNAGRYYLTSQMVSNGLLPRVIKVWVTADDARVCPYCKALEGKRVALDDQFFVPTAKEAAYSDGRFPPMHPRCRCVVAYMEDENDGMFN